MKIGLSLASHPLVGIAALPLIDWIEKQDDFKLVKILGTGQGAFSAALISSKIPPAEIQKILMTFCESTFYQGLNYQTALSFTTFQKENYHPFQSLFQPDSKEKFYEEILGDRKVETQPIALNLIATDLYTAEPYLITHGLLSKAVYGASAWFPLHPPAHFQGRLLVNGAMSESIPVMEDDNIDIEVSIVIKDPRFWKHTKKATDNWAFFDRLFQIIEPKTKKMIRSQKNKTIIPLCLEIDKTLPLEGIKEEDIDYLYEVAAPEIMNVIELITLKAREMGSEK